MVEKIAAVIYKTEKGMPLFFVGRRTEKYDGIWQYVTGHKEGDEAPVETLLREISEELGEVKILNLIDLKKENLFSSESKKKYREKIFAVQIEKVEKLQAEEFVEYKWLKEDEALKRVSWPSHKDSISLTADLIRAKKYPKIFIITGPSGSGKDTIINSLLKIPSLNLLKSRTATTRKRRAGETNERIFVQRDEFEKLYNEHRLIEKNLFNGEWYGASRDELIKVLSTNHNAIMEIDIHGAKKFKNEFSNVVAIFLKVSPNFLKKRLEERGTESAEAIESRLSIAKIELQKSSICDYRVENKQGAVDEAIKKIRKIIEKEIS